MSFNRQKYILFKEEFMKQKFIIYSISFFILSAFFTTNAFGQNKSKEVKNATWQTSVSEIVNVNNPTIGIRDKWGSLESYDALFVVTGPNKKIYKARAKGTGDEFTYVNFPSDFDKKTSLQGIYKVVFYVNGFVIGRDKFKFQL